MQLMTVAEVAKDLGLSLRAVQRYCQNGTIPCQQRWINNHCSYHFDPFAYQEWKRKNFSGVKREDIRWSNRIDKELSKTELEAEKAEWLEWCASGKLSGRPIGPRTVELYDYYFGLFVQGLGKYPSKPFISVENLRTVLGSYSPARFSTKLNIYSAAMSFAKFLIEKNELEPIIRDKFKALRPKRYLPAKKTSLNQSQYLSLVQEINNAKSIGGFRAYDKMLSKALIVFITNTGLRNSECCKLKLENLDLESRKVFVKLGKGNKNREVGINQETYEVMIEYLRARDKFDSELVFVNKLGNQFTVEILAKKIRKVTTRLGCKDISPHSLRRTFASINSANGKPLNHLRIALGHADLSTTQSYIMTTQDEVVEAMKGW